MEKDYQSVLIKVLQRIKPDEMSKEQLSKLSEKALKLANEIGKPYEVEAILAGSFARNTWLSDKKEFDVFLLFNPKFSREELEKIGLEIGKKVIQELGGKWRIKYAEHPYVRGKIGNFEIDVVPCYKVSSTSELKSAVDRTPFHLRYVKAKLTPRLCDEVILLKQLLKANELYGADAKTQGFSGYACELLIIRYGSFIQVLKECLSWNPGHIIDIENLWGIKDYPKLKRKFKYQPLIIIDPVDKNRNVTAALSPENFFRFKKIAREFLKNPKTSYFSKKRIKPITPNELKKVIEERGTELLLIKFKPPAVLPDILWPQLRKFAERLQNILEERKYEFKVLRRDVFTDERKIALVLMEMEVAKLPKIQKRIGPSIFDLDDSERFLKKYSRIAVTGPFVEGTNWCVEIRRKFLTAKEKIIDSLKKPTETLKAKGIPSHIAEEIAKDFEIIDGKEIFREIESNKRIGIFLRLSLIHI